jgi:hypothetical protein
MLCGSLYIDVPCEGKQTCSFGCNVETISMLKVQRWLSAVVKMDGVFTLYT